ncbi:thioredoxin family protein [Nocardia cyriacigeorgica]|uniref:MPT46 n=1 Tax=Nocardia cyriacigeorgica TaxID=135487 RepID=A0A4U8VWN1_9NOCA|nr:thioredoxin domain-containing protein [Nocardia cyriacigeorgica]VFA97792.1 MPT46 [Nocardia cyriacigeorgica]
MFAEKSTDVVAVTGESFDREVLHADGPVLVDFWAPWCTTCRAMAPMIAELAAEHAGRLTVAAIDAAAHPEPAHDYGVVSIPSILLFSGGTVQKRIVGVHTKASLLRELSDFLAAHASSTENLSNRPELEA